MHRSLVIRNALNSAALLLTITALACSDSTQLPQHYSLSTATPGGSGRVYMGREIAAVMSHLDADKLSRPERATQEQTHLLIDLLPLQENLTIADIGAGSGFFTLQLAERLPAGQIIAVDIQPEMLALIRSRTKAQGLNNVKLVTATEQSPNLASNSIDLALLVDSYHEFSWPREYMQNLRSALRPKGLIVLVEQRSEDPNIRLVETHKMSAAQMIIEMQAVGLTLVDRIDRLPKQHFLLFGRDSD